MSGFQGKMLICLVHSWLKEISAFALKLVLGENEAWIGECSQNILETIFKIFSRSETLDLDQSTLKSCCKTSHNSSLMFCTYCYSFIEYLYDSLVEAWEYSSLKCTISSLENDWNLYAFCITLFENLWKIILKLSPLDKLW